VIRDTQANLFVVAGGALPLSPAALASRPPGISAAAAAALLLLLLVVGFFSLCFFARASFRCFLFCRLASFRCFFFHGSLVSYIFRTNSPFLLFFVCVASRLFSLLSWS
jgi:hypothetical protein